MKLRKSNCDHMKAANRNVTRTSLRRSLRMVEACPLKYKSSAAVAACNNIPLEAVCQYICRHVFDFFDFIKWGLQ